MTSFLKNESIRKPLKSTIAYHVYFWLVIYFLFILENPISFKHHTYAFTFILKNLFPVYLHFYIFDKYLMKKKYVFYFSLLILIIFTYGTINYWLTPQLELKTRQLGSFVLMAFSVILISTAFKQGIKGIKQEFLYREIKEKQIKTELDLLRAQIHPHFLFNTLNNLFSMARKHNDTDTAEGIAKLSHLLRYMIYDSNTEKIILKKEVAQINNFIELQKFRFSKDDDIKISFQIEGNVENVKIVPMLLIPFVENAFKHSISLQKPVIIQIFLEIKENFLRFSVKNTLSPVRSKKNGTDSGIGLTNIKRRLELLYPGSHELNISEDKDYFQIDLRLKL